MIINESTFEITTSQYDYGVPVFFRARTDNGWQLGDEIVLCFDNVIDDKRFTVDKADYIAEFALTEQEAEALFSKALIYKVSLPYSAKRYRNGKYRQTIFDSKLTVKSTVKMEDDNE